MAPFISHRAKVLLAVHEKVMAKVEEITPLRNPEDLSTLKALSWQAENLLRQVKDEEEKEPPSDPDF